MTEEQQLAWALQMSMAGTMEEDEGTRMDTDVQQQQVCVYAQAAFITPQKKWKNHLFFGVMYAKLGQSRI